MIKTESPRHHIMAENEQCCYGASRASSASRPVGELSDEPERSTALPEWVEKLSVQHGNRLPFSEKWANQLQGLSINGEEFLTADSFGLQRSATVDLIADACEFNFSRWVRLAKRYLHRVRRRDVVGGSPGATVQSLRSTYAQGRQGCAA